MRILALLFVFTLGIAGSPSPRAIDAAVRAQLAQTGVPGAAIAIVHNGKVVYERGYGVRSRNGPPVGIHTHFEIGSDTKQFTASAMLQLKEEGKLGLDDRLAKYIPDFPHAGDITLRQLLNQTSGLPDYVMTNHFVHITQTSGGSLSRIERMVAGPLRFRPGSRWEYSNTNYAALGRVIELVSHQSYHEYVRTQLFARAGMRESGFISDERSFNDMASGYWHGLRNSAAAVPAPEIGDSWTAGAGNIVSTVDDLARWDIALQAGRIVKASDLRLMTSPATLSDGKRDDYGFGWWIDPVHGHTDVYHDGDTFGMSSSNNLFPDFDLDVIVLENEPMDTASSTARAILDALLPSLPGTYRL